MKPPLLAVVAAAALLAAAPTLAQPSVALPARDRALTARFAPVFTVGEEEGASHEVFANVRGVAFDAQENLYVLDAGNHRVLVFDRTGRFVRQIGRRGTGPGELSSPARVTVLADGTVVVTDNGSRGFVLFGRTGQFLRSVPFEQAHGLVPQGLAPAPGGGVLVGGQPLPLGGAAAQHFLVRYDLAPRGRAARVAVLPDEGATGTETERTSAPGATVVIPRRRVFAPSLRWAALPGGGMAAATGPGYAIRILDARGATTRVLTRAIRPRPVSQEDRERAIEQRQSGTSNVTVTGGASLSPEVRRAVQRAVSDVEFAATVPVIERMIADPQGRLWIQRDGASAGAPSSVDVVSAAGVYAGTFAGTRAPDAFSAGGRAAFILTDEDGIERVTVRAVPRLP